MDCTTRWRVARFSSERQREEFLEHARAMALEGLEVEPLSEDLRVRFRAPARYEVGVAGMVIAHGGKVLPTLDLTELWPSAEVR